MNWLKAFASVASGVFLAACGGPEGETDLGAQAQALTYPSGTARTVTSVRAVYKDGAGAYQAAAGFEALRAAGAPDAELYKVRIGEVDAPATRTALVFLSAGQKASSGSSHENGLTGQSGYWDSSCNDVSCANVTLDARSLAMKLRAQGWFPPATTWFAVANDSNFDHLFDTTTKQQMVTGFANWLTEQVRPETTAIYLGGSSRGGCLAMRMAQSLRANPALDGIQLYVSSFDGVCKNSQGELGTTNTKINNPVRPWGTFYGGWATALTSQYSNRTNLHIFHVVGGAEVVPASGIRAFAAYSGSPPSTGSNLDWGWYKQTWVKWAHKEIGNPYTEPSSGNQALAVSQTIDAQLTWLDGLL
ncbi:MAG TPA: hypothetical protein VGK67_00565 [Myxococcales bacterium]